MPRFDIQEQQTVLAAPRAEASSFGGGQGLAQVGQGISNVAMVADRYRAAEKERKLSSAISSASQQLQKTVMDLELDPDFETHQERYDAALKDIKANVESQLGDKALFGLFKTDFDPIATKQGFQVQKKVIFKQHDRAKADLANQTAVMSTLAARAEDETERNYYLTNGRVAIQTMLDSGVITAVEAQKQDRDFVNSVQLAEVREMIRVDPGEAAQELLDPAGMFSSLDENRRQVWIDRAISASESQIKSELAEEAKQQRIIDEEEKTVRQEAAKTGDTLAAQGDLTSDWVFQNKDNLSPSDYRYFTKKISGNDITTTRSNPEVFVDLFEKSGGEIDVRAEARAHLINGNLSQPDYVKIVKRVEEGLIEEELPSWYKRGEQFINTSLKPSDLNSDPFKNIRHADSINEWRVWAENHPNVTFEEAEKEFKRIVNGAVIGKIENILAAKNQPRYFTGDRTKMTMDQIIETAKKTRQAFNNGQITEAEFLREGIKIQSFKRAIEDAQQAGAQ